MGAFEVSQRTKDTMFNATSLLKQWNKSSGENRQLINFWNIEGLPEVMYEIIKGEGIALKEENIALCKSLDSNDLKKALSATSRGKNGGTWMHPYLFIKFAMYISPKFEYHVLKFVADQLLEFRNESGDLTKDLNSSVQRLFKNIDYPKLAIGINWCVYGKHKVGIRNLGTEAETKEIVDLQKNLSFSCDRGHITSFEMLMDDLRDIYCKKYR